MTLQSSGDISVSDIRIEQLSGLGLVSYWKLEEIVADSSVFDSFGTNDGSIMGGVTQGVPGGNSGNMYDFTGGYVYVDHSSDFDFGTGNFAISSWINTSTTTGLSYYGIVGKANWGVDGFYSMLNFNYYPVGGWKNTIQITGDIAVNDGEWHHIVFQRTGTTSVELYIDGSLNKSATSDSDSVDTSFPMEIGNLGTSYPWDQKLDEIAIFGQSLTAEDVSMIYQFSEYSLVEDARGVSNPYIGDNSVGGSPTSITSFYNYSHVNRGRVFFENDTSANCFAARTDMTWERLATGNSSPWYDMTYGKGYFVAVANATANNIMNSEDGSTWILSSDPSGVTLQSISFDGDKFIALSNGGTSVTSYDGSTWFGRPVPTTGTWWNTVYGHAGWVVCGTSGAEPIMLSVDGSTWETYAVPTGGPTNLQRVVYSDGIYMIAGGSGTDRIMNSRDGSVWGKSTPTALNYMIAAGGGVYVGINGTTGIYSYDASNWTQVTIPSGVWRECRYDNGIFMGIGNSAANIISSNGIEWTRYVAPTGATSAYYGNGWWANITANNSQANRARFEEIDGIQVFPIDSSDNNLNTGVGWDASTRNVALFETDGTDEKIITEGFGYDMFTRERNTTGAWTLIDSSNYYNGKEITLIDLSTNDYKLNMFANIDPSAGAFLDATGITDQTQKDAINDLVVQLKADGIWDKMYAIYPMVGGTATTHKYNLIDPRDTSLAYELAWSGGWTHSSTGALPNGTNSYADTFLTPDITHNTTNYVSQGYYSRTATGDSDEYVMGCSQSGARGMSLIARRTTDLGYNFQDVPSGGYANTYGTVTDASAFFHGTQDGTDIKFFRNSTQVSTNTSAGNDPFATVSMVLGAINNNGTKGQWTDKECAFAYIGHYLTNVEITDYTNAVDTFQTSLSRNV